MIGISYSSHSFLDRTGLFELSDSSPKGTLLSLRDWAWRDRRRADVDDSAEDSDSFSDEEVGVSERS
jgi:hypothetical protein